ncbi:glutamate--tRNA ligase [Myxococcota bacterium]|nr:glutamate--tRNA ligase [Myxococcota bacterium]MBU1381163.1 glutamate--tRNA ligase [Myxococcota bacterium]MBU1496735.1 glutamate--tRNA ligase [Myxococcota bacterium]
MTEKTVRTRIAPSPTGDPHVGTAYIALFNYVFAKKHGGQFLLRIEDTDQTRSRSDSELAIMESLNWLGLSWDEGPDKGGPYGPYRQSERQSIYKEQAEILLEKGEAYRCFCTPEILAADREAELKSGSRRTGYNRRCRNIDAQTSAKRAADGEPFTIRLKMAVDGDSVFTDRLRGEIRRPNEELDDQVLLKSDGFPTYHLANVVDDHLMKITHVIRAEEWIPSTPKHVRLYEAFGWEKPEFIHMPLLRNPDKNKSKISKRKNPVSLKFYKETGILPEALVNFLGLMGFSFGNDVEKFTVEQMIEVFSFDNVSLGGPVFDLEKLTWLNGLYIRDLGPEELLDRVMGLYLNREYFQKIVPLVHERMRYLSDFIDSAPFFYNGDLDYSAEGNLMVPKGRTQVEMASMFEEGAEKIDALESFSASLVEEIFRTISEQKEWKIKEIFMPVRIACLGRKASPPLFECIEVIGRERIRRRLRKAAEYVRTMKMPA